MTPALRRCCFICLLQNFPSFAARFIRGLSDQGIKHLRNEFLYLAQADNRLGPTGALIAGNDVSLIAGQNLDNVGSLHAANNLSAVAGNKKPDQHRPDRSRQPARSARGQ
ncbi:Filamentous hemagglutinin, intein-containing [Pseudomonas syringae pv. atrofaciens]|nr:Filamentous hemagglutinin, intein-containing [Pseudomonas syringae pv. atrofaciens]